MILIDADACPVVRLTERLAEKYSILCTLFCDTNHVLHSTYSEIKVVAAGADAVDFAIIGACKAGDIIITQDYGVAAMALGKGAYAFHQSGMQYTNDNIDRLLMERHTAGKARRSRTKHHTKGPKKRTEADDLQFEEALESFLRQMQV